MTSAVFFEKSWYKWVAQYNSECTYRGSYTMWQATSKGSVDGISGNVDIDFWIEADADGKDYSYPNTYTNSGNYSNDIVGVAKTQIGYTELESANGEPVIDSETPYYTKYGAAYGNPNGHWCAYFVLWCAEQADIPTSIICKSSACGSCNYFVNWFKSNHRWKDRDYTPIKGDLIFFDWDGDGKANHIGIVDSVEDGYIVTVEGNTGGENGYTVMKCRRKDSILGYGVPNYALREKINGYSRVKQTAYMLPDSASATVWETWADDELQILCEDGDYYLVLYPYVYTGKFVAAYVPKSSVTTSADISVGADFYGIDKTGTAVCDTVVYHNASTDDLMGSTANHKIRATLNENDEMTVLFEDADFYFVKTNQISGYVLKSDVKLNFECIWGDVNGDTKVDSADAGLILRYDAGFIELTEEKIGIADINKDGKVDSADAGLILRYDAGIIKGFK